MAVQLSIVKLPENLLLSHSSHKLLILIYFKEPNQELQRHFNGKCEPLQTDETVNLGVHLRIARRTAFDCRLAP
jgi:hypothetical protein